MESKRFDMQVFIIHPTWRPSDITVDLGMQPMFTHGAGEQRMTPKGTTLQGKWPDTRWRHSRRFDTSNQHFLSEVAELTAELERCPAFFQSLAATGGSGQLIIQFLGDGYFGDTLPPSLMARLGALQLGLGIECFTVSQAPRQEV